ncbi:MAG: hypothetical protein PHV59_05290, partial [Victivallales bacterium]|nr:hypothetical protein [Victivallales bacterium]
RLIPQFSGGLDCYRESFGKRMGIWCERNLPFYSLLNHIRIAFFNNESFNQWVIDHPYDNPLTRISLTVDAGEKGKSNSTIDWTKKGITEQDWSWVPPAESKQWQAFKRTVRILKRHDNDVLVMVGPINPYMLSPKSLEKYRCLQHEICKWLDKEKIKYFLVPDMPSAVYADASHPLAPGYAIIAGDLVKKDFLTEN